MKESYKEKLWLIFLWAIFGGILVSFFFYSESRKFAVDEFEHIHTAWKIVQGQEIYIDFFQHHHPFFDYLIALVIHTFGSTVTSIFISRYVMLFMTAGILATTYFLSLRVFKNTQIGVISVILTSTVVTFYSTTIEIRPDVLQSLAGLLSIYFLFVYYDKKSLGYLLASSVFLAISFLVLQKSMVLIIPIGALLLYDLYKKQIYLKHVVLYAATFLICVLPYYIYLLLNGSLEQYFVMNWLVNYHITQSFGKLKFLSSTIRENIITTVFYFIGVLTLMRSGMHKRFAILSLSLLILPIVMFTNLWRWYFMFAIPLVGIIASYALYSTVNSKWSRVIVIIGAIYIPMLIMHNHGLFKMDDSEQSQQIDKINYVLSITDEHDMVYDRRIIISVFRNDIDYFWFCNECITAYKQIADYEYNLFDLIFTQRPKVISTYGINRQRRRIKNIWIKNGYRVSDKYPDLLIRKDEVIYMYRY